MIVKTVAGTKTTGPNASDGTTARTKSLLRRCCFDPVIVGDTKLVFIEEKRWYSLDTNRHIDKEGRKGFIYDQEFRVCGTPEIVQKTIKGTKGLQLNKLKGKTTDVEFTFSGKFVEAEVKRVVDADTVILSFYLDGKNYCWSCRLLGIDSKEKKTELGDKVAAKIKVLLEGIKKVYAVLGEFDNHSRILVVLYLDEHRKINLNRRIFDENRGSVCEYWGGNKAEAWALEEST